MLPASMLSPTMPRSAPPGATRVPQNNQPPSQEPSPSPTNPASNSDCGENLARIALPMLGGGGASAAFSVTSLIRRTLETEWAGAFGLTGAGAGIGLGVRDAACGGEPWRTLTPRQESLHLGRFIQCLAFPVSFGATGAASLFCLPAQTNLTTRVAGMTLAACLSMAGGLGAQALPGAIDGGLQELGNDPIFRQVDTPRVGTFEAIARRFLTTTLSAGGLGGTLDFLNYVPSQNLTELGKWLCGLMVYGAGQACASTHINDLVKQLFRPQARTDERANPAQPDVRVDTNERLETAEPLNPEAPPPAAEARNQSSFVNIHDIEGNQSGSRAQQLGAPAPEPPAERPPSQQGK